VVAMRLTDAMADDISRQATADRRTQSSYITVVRGNAHFGAIRLKGGKSCRLYQLLK